MTMLLEARGLSCGYGSRAVVHGLDLEVRTGEIIAILGPNGAGKTTTIKTLSGLLDPLKGEVWLDGVHTRKPLHRRARNGLSLVPEDRGVFRQLTVGENLRVGRGDTEGALALFPALVPLLQRKLGLCSGGEQQMVALARALARRPRVLLVDELSLGLAPLVVARLLEAIREAVRGGLGVVLVEQHVQEALRVASRAYVMSRGTIVMSGTAAEVKDRLAEVEAGYLSGPTEG